MGEAQSYCNPYFITGPSLISFSGGRTSAFMLKQILDAHGGALPDDVVVTFANTGKERPETLRFVHECETRWGVRVHWLEWRPTPKQTANRPAFQAWVAERSDRQALMEPAGFVEVGYNSASREGEPFEALIAMKQYTPNAVTRFCTIEMKIRIMGWFCRSLGWDHWQNIVGLRYDEGLRVMKALARNDENKERWKTAMPMSKAKHTKRDVLAFWLGANVDPKNLTHSLPQGFDLGLYDHEGNCDGCFLKGRGKLEALIRADPTMPDWWIAQEEGCGKGRFVTDYSYRELAHNVARSPSLFDDATGWSDHDVECGLLCEPVA